MSAVQAAAVELLAERGPREMTVRDVAERAGVNHALVHRHFGTKDALIRAVVAELIQVGSRAVRDSVGPDEEPAFAVDLRDGTDDNVSIDELEPQVRATIRALLADLNGCSEDAEFQLDLAVRELDPLIGLETVRRALTMTVALLQWTGEA